MNLVRSLVTFITLVVLSAGFVVAQERESSKDIPSIAQDALKSVVTVETKDGLGTALSLVTMGRSSRTTMSSRARLLEKSGFLMGLLI